MLVSMALEGRYVGHVGERFLGAEAKYSNFVCVLNQVVAITPNGFYMPAQKGCYAFSGAFARNIGHLNPRHLAELQMGDVVTRPGAGTAAHHRVRVLLGIFDEVGDGLEGAVF